MAAYVTLHRSTDQGTRAIGNAVGLAQHWHAEVERRGIKVLELCGCTASTRR